jgi:hypothetical protein
VLRGWINYYGRFYRSALYPLFHRINTYLLRRIRKKYRVGVKQAVRRLAEGYALAPRYFAHWALQAPGWDGDQDNKSRMTRDCHVRICGSPGVRFPRRPDHYPDSPGGTRQLGQCVGEDAYPWRVGPLVSPAMAIREQPLRLRALRLGCLVQDVLEESAEGLVDRSDRFGDAVPEGSEGHVAVGLVGAVFA